MASGERAATAWSLCGGYFLYFAIVGIEVPYLPGWLADQGLSGAEVGALLALGPAVGIFAPTIWAHFADRSGRSDRVLRVVAIGAGLAVVPLLFADGFWAILGCLALYAAFNSTTQPLLESIALHRVAVAGGSHARLRLFGSLGFMTVSFSVGFVIDGLAFGAVGVLVGLVAAQAVWMWTLDTRSPPPARGPGIASGLRLLGDRELRLLLASTCLHWGATTTYFGTFPMYVDDLGFPGWVLGGAAGLGALIEIGVMYHFPRLRARFSLTRILAFGYLLTAVRWLILSTVHHPVLFVAVAVIHGVTFGSFVLAGVAAVDARAPADRRAAGQALFISSTFALGGLLGYLAGGIGYDALGGSGVLLVAMGVELAALCLVLLVRRAAGSEAAEAMPSTGLPRPSEA